MLNPNLNAWIGIISHNRPNNVPEMERLVGPCTWYVGAGEAETYKAAGAGQIVESGALCRSRNAILDDAYDRNLTAIQISDDLKRLQLVAADGKPITVEFNFAMEALLNQLKLTPFFLAGVAPTANAFYFNPKEEVSHKKFIVGDLIAVAPSSLRFDENMTLKEDYDYTAQHIQVHGGAVRCNFILATFQHRTNKGGACDVRSAALEQENILYLYRKWNNGSQIFRPNGRRPNEILMRWPKK